MHASAAAGLCAALAATAMTAPPAAAELAVKISGFVGFEAALVLNTSNSGSFDRDYDFRSGGRLQFDVKDVTDGGLEYGARIRFDNVNRGRRHGRPDLHLPRRRLRHRHGRQCRRGGRRLRLHLRP
jgi:hypothetical protein